jgi:hypothetical protein
MVARDENFKPLAGVGKNGPLSVLSLKSTFVVFEPLYCLMGNCCSGTATLPSSPSRSSPPGLPARSVTPAPVPSHPNGEDELVPSSQPRSRTTSMPKLLHHSGVSSQGSNPRSRVVSADSAPQRPRSKSSVPQNAITRPQPVAAFSRNLFDCRPSGSGESDD